MPQICCLTLFILTVCNNMEEDPANQRANGVCKQTLRVKWWSRKKMGFFFSQRVYILDGIMDDYALVALVGYVCMCFFLALSIWFMRNVSTWNEHCECEQICGLFFSPLQKITKPNRFTICKRMHTIFASVCCFFLRRLYDGCSCCWCRLRRLRWSEYQKWP